jgi:CRISPR-associated protein Cas2
MYVILVYDIEEKRVNKVCKYMKRYLPRVQNSVFEGDLSEAKLERMKVGLMKIIQPPTDAVLLWVLRDARWAERQVLGSEKLPVSTIF